MSLVTIVILLVVVAIALYIVSLIPMDATIKRIIQILILVVFALWLLSAIGLLPGNLRVD